MPINELTSPLRRAKIGVEIWLAYLPKYMIADAEMALAGLVGVAEREIDQAYRDGASNQSAGTRSRKMTEAAPPPSS